MKLSDFSSLISKWKNTNYEKSASQFVSSSNNLRSINRSIEFERQATVGQLQESPTRFDGLSDRSNYKTIIPSAHWPNDTMSLDFFIVTWLKNVHKDPTNWADIVHQPIYVLVTLLKMLFTEQVLENATAWAKANDNLDPILKLASQSLLVGKPIATPTNAMWPVKWDVTSQQWKDFLDKITSYYKEIVGVDVIDKPTTEMLQEFLMSITTIGVFVDDGVYVSQDYLNFVKSLDFSIKPGTTTDSSKPIYMMIEQQAFRSTSGNFYTPAIPDTFTVESVANYVPKVIATDGKNEHVHLYVTNKANIAHSQDVYSALDVSDATGPADDPIFTNKVLPYLQNRNKAYVNKLTTLNFDTNKPVLVNTLPVFYQILEWIIINEMQKGNPAPVLNNINEVRSLINKTFPKAVIGALFKGQNDDSLPITTNTKPIQLQAPEIVDSEAGSDTTTFYYKARGNGDNTFFHMGLCYDSRIYEEYYGMQTTIQTYDTSQLLAVFLGKWRVDPFFAYDQAINIDNLGGYPSNGVVIQRYSGKIRWDKTSKAVRNFTPHFTFKDFDDTTWTVLSKIQSTGWNMAVSSSTDVGDNRNKVFFPSNNGDLVTVQVGQQLTYYSIDTSKVNVPVLIKVSPDADSVQLSQETNNGNTIISDAVSQMGMRLVPASIINIENALNNWPDVLNNSVDQVDNDLVDIHNKFRKEYSDTGEDFIARIAQVLTAASGSTYDAGDQIADDLMAVSKMRDYNWNQDICEIYSTRLRLYMEPYFGQLFSNIQAIAHAQPVDYVIGFTKQITNVINASKGGSVTQLQNLINSVPTVITTWKQNISKISLFPDHDTLRGQDVSKSKLYDILDASYKTHSNTAIDQAQSLIKYILSYTGGTSKLRDGNIDESDISLRCEAYAAQQQAIFKYGLNADVPSLQQALAELTNEIPEIIATIVTTLGHAVLAIGDLVLHFLSNMASRITTLLGLGPDIMINQSGDPVDALNTWDAGHGLLTVSSFGKWIIPATAYELLYSIYGNPQVTSLNYSSLVFRSRNGDVVVVLDGGTKEVRAYSSCITGSSSRLMTPFVGQMLSGPSSLKGVANIASYSTAEGIDKTKLINISESLGTLQNIPFVNSWARWLNPALYLAHEIELHLQKEADIDQADVVSKIISGGLNLFLSNILGDPDSESVLNHADRFRAQVKYSYAGFLPNFRIQPINGISGLIYQISTVIMLVAIAATIITKGSFLGKIIHASSSVSKFMGVHFWNDHKSDKLENKIVSEIGSTNVVDVDVKAVGDQVAVIATQIGTVVAATTYLKKALNDLSEQIEQIDSDMIES